MVIEVLLVMPPMMYGGFGGRGGHMFTLQVTKVLSGANLLKHDSFRTGVLNSYPRMNAELRMQIIWRCLPFPQQQLCKKQNFYIVIIL